MSGLGCSNSYLTGRDFVFEYTSPGAEVVGIELENLNDDRHSLFVFDGCPDDVATNCMYDGTSVAFDSVFIETVHFQNPGTYYIVVSSYAISTINFDFNIDITYPIGNICENALPINSIPYNYTGTTVGSGNDYTNGLGCSNSYLTGRDFVFEYNSPGDEVIGIELENLNDDRHSLFVFDGCPDDAATNCMYDGTAISIDSVFLETVYFQNPGTYYVVVSSYAISTLVYDFDISFTRPIGNICENARVINSFPYSFTGTTRETGDDYSSGDGCSSSYLNGRDHVFEYTPTGDEYLSLNLTNLNDDRHGLFIIEGCPDDPLAVCFESGVQSGSSPISLNTSSCLTAGQSYYIVVSSYDISTIWYDFTLQIDQDLQAMITATESSGLANDNYLCPDEAGSAIVNLTASASGGNGGSYSYEWDNPSNSTTAMIAETPNLARTYSVTATDSGGCSVVVSQAVNFNPALSVSINVAENSGVANDKIICSYDAPSQATLTANVSGGTSGYSYNWSPQSGNNAILLTSPNATNSYSVDIQDARGCSASATETLEIPVSPIMWSGPTNRNWYDNPGYWSKGRFPTVCDDVVIPSGVLVNVRNGFHAWSNTLDVQGELETKPGAELDSVAEN